MRILTVTLLAITIAFNLRAQEQLGLRLENYAGVSSLDINPAGNLNNPFKWDFNLVGGGVFFENNYAFLRETNLMRLAQYKGHSAFVNAKKVEGEVPTNTFVIDFFNDEAKRFFNTSGFVAGPALAVRIGERHSAGFFTKLRSAGGSVDIPNQFSYYKYDAQQVWEGFEIPKMRAALLNWSEIGLNYALKVPTAKGSLNFGVNLKFLQGYEAAYIENHTPYQHVKLTDKAMLLQLPDLRYGYTSEAGASAFAERNGKGLGADLGFTWILKDHKEGYRLKLGASLLDLGYLDFDKNAQAHQLRIDSSLTLRYSDYADFKLPADLKSIFQTFSEKSLGDSLATLEQNSFRMALPAALSLQADFGVTEHFYLNALYMQRVRTQHIGPQRGTLLALTPRFQYRWSSVSFPVSIYGWSRAHFGMAFRAGWIVVGSDDLASFFVNKKYSGSDLYIAIKINPFEKSGKKGSGTGK